VTYRNDFVKKAGKEGGLHGDIGLVRIESIPEKAQPVKNNIVAYGEVTGHHHVLLGEDVQVYSLESQLFAKVGEEVSINHQEHGTIMLEAGNYFICQQVEYDGEKERRVLD
jgi:hypothetical protein